MGFTPAAGVPMSTRSGDLDPGLFWYLSHAEGFDAKRFDQMVNFQSGLLGISETSSDMRDLLDRETQDVRALKRSLCFAIRLESGLAHSLLRWVEWRRVFAGGIGENAPVVRARICGGLAFLGIQLEEKPNAASEGVISTAAGRVVVRVIRTDEELTIAKTVCRVLGLG
jgi:acetate kinase